MEKYGWVCPKCGAGVNPDVDKCPCMAQGYPLMPPYQQHPYLYSYWNHLPVIISDYPSVPGVTTSDYTGGPATATGYAGSPATATGYAGSPATATGYADGSGIGRNGISRDFDQSMTFE